MALSQFMPYGAPELLADQDQRMARASAVATSLLVLLFVGLMLVIPRAPIAANRPAEFPSEEHWMEPPPLDPPAERPVAPAAPSQLPGESVPVPVPDVLVPETPADAPADPGSADEPGEGSTGPGQDEGGGLPGDGGVAERDPVWGVYELVEELPVLISSPRAEYSDLARDAGIEGRVVVRILVGKDGRVKDAVVDPKFSIPILDAIALEAARGSVFTPALNNGHPVAVWVARPYEFRLH